VTQGNECPVCKSEADVYNTGRGGGDLRYDCPRCGEFELSGTLVATLQPSLDAGIYRRALMSHNLRRTQRTNNKPPLIKTYDVERFWFGERLPSPQRQADDLILWVGDNQLSPNEPIRCAHAFLSAWVGTSLGSPRAPDGGLGWLCEYLENTAGLLRVGADNTGPGASRFQLTMHGWQKFAELKEKGVATTQAFVAMWFDASTDEAWTDGLHKGIAASGYDPLRIDQTEHVNKICDEIIAQIRRSRFVVADYTGHRGGVYYEAGYAAGRGLIVIPTCRQDEMNKLHFDIRQYNCIDWQTPAELASRLQARIEALVGEGPGKVRWRRS